MSFHKRSGIARCVVKNDDVSRMERMVTMKYKVTVEMETKKRFLGVPYIVTEKKHILMDGKKYRKMKQKKRKEAEQRKDEAAATALIILEEEMVDLFGEDY